MSLCSSGCAPRGFRGFMSADQCLRVCTCIFLFKFSVWAKRANKKSFCACVCGCGLCWVQLMENYEENKYTTNFPGYNTQQGQEL